MAGGPREGDRKKEEGKRKMSCFRAVGQVKPIIQALPRARITSDRGGGGKPIQQPATLAAGKNRKKKNLDNPGNSQTKKEKDQRDKPYDVEGQGGRRYAAALLLRDELNSGTLKLRRGREVPAL